MQLIEERPQRRRILLSLANLESEKRLKGAWIIEDCRHAEEYTDGIGCLIKVLLTDFFAEREVPRPPRYGVLGAKRSKKLSLTGWPFALRRGAIMPFGRIVDVA